ncbi:MAG TPA: gamma-glutamyltransferase [Acidimicrobiales bacterium]
MTVETFATATVHAPSGMVVTPDHLASSAGVAILRAGGSAADAAVAAGAVLAVTNQHECGMGGDLFALVHQPGERPAALCAAGRAGSGADPVQLRAEGHQRMPSPGDVRAVTVPGCVDGWIELHRRFGRLPLAEVLEPAMTYAAAGFPVSPQLAESVTGLVHRPGADDYRDPAMAAGGRVPAGALIRRPGVAAALDAVVTGGRAGFYLGAFGYGLIALGDGLFTWADLARNQAEWMEPLHTTAWGYDVWGTPPPSQGYLTLAGVAVAEGLDLPAPDDPAWAHLLSEAARQVGADRPQVLHEGADGAALLAPERIAAQRAAIDPDRRRDLAPLTAGGGTVACCVVDRDRMGVSLLQSNASAWGAGLAEPETGIFLHNRGIGFSLEAGHPAEYGPGRRPPHTLAPALVTRPDGSLRSVLATMGGDAQPQILVQLLARLLHHGEPAGAAVDAGRWVLAAAPFRTWDDGGPGVLAVEPHASAAWDDGLRARGHTVTRHEEPHHAFGHAQVIDVDAGEGVLDAAADPRALVGAAAGY